MKRVLFVAAAVALLVMGLSVPGEARFRGSVWIGGPVWGPGWWGPAYTYPYYYPQPQVVIQQPAPERYVTPAPQPEEPVWYFCPDQKAYYPYVKHCPGGWQKVMPSPPPAEEKE